MAASTSRLTGEEWQNWANRILSVHYGPTEYQQIPDNDRGDAGLEGFTRTDGHAYQAYGCEEPISASDRYEKQRNKMTRDIAKFIDNQVTLKRIFGNVKINRWVLFVPYCGTNEIVAQTRVLDWYLRGQDVLEALREYPETYAKIKSAIGVSFLVGLFDRVFGGVEHTIEGE